MSLTDKIEEYVSFQLENYTRSRVRAPKVIHDTILGSNLFMPHEIHILDLPLIQRLRRISQVSIASLVYPSGNHNRFEHTLGVAVIGEQIVKALYRKINEGKNNGIAPYNIVEVDENYVLNHVRMAAIMHDSGHGPFSHLSEKIFKHFEDFKELTKNNPILASAKAHEVLSYLIVTSERFKDYFKDEIEAKYGIQINLDLVGEMIVGHVSDPKLAFLIEIINGAFDADKLDYIQRDSHFTGIKMVLDLHRLFYTVDLVLDDKEYLRLSVDLSGVSTLEQIIFNKMMLFNTVYHHHKVRAAECLFKALVELCIDKQAIINGMKIENTASFLYFTDDDIYSLAGSQEGLIKELAVDLSYRRLPKRALVISRKTSDTESEKLLEITKVSDNPKGTKLLINAISEATSILVNKIPEEEIWIDLQKGPNFEEAIQCPIKSQGEPKGYILLHDVLPVDDWVKAFSQNKWSGYIFTKPENRKIVHEAAKKVISEAFDIKLNQFSRYLCKFDDDVMDEAGE